MDYHVLESRYVGGHVVWLRFRDGTSGEIDLAPALKGPVFEPLRDPGVFTAFQIHPEFHTLVWPNGADIAPEYLHDNVRVTVEAKRTAAEEWCQHASAHAATYGGKPWRYALVPHDVVADNRTLASLI